MPSVMERRKVVVAVELYCLVHTIIMKIHIRYKRDSKALTPLSLMLLSMSCPP